MNKLTKYNKQSETFRINNYMQNMIQEAYLELPGIYKITDISTGKFYIGSAKNFKHRFTTHLSNLKYNNHHNRQLQFIFNKRADQLQFTVIERINDITALSCIEQTHLDKAFHEELCINSSPVAGRPPSYNEMNIEQQRRAVKKANQTKLSKYGQTGVICTAESIKKSANTRRGVKRSPEIAKKMIETKKKNGTLNVPHSKLQGRKRPNHSKRMKEVYREGRLIGLERDQGGSNNGNCKGTVTMKCIDTGEIKSLYRFKWNECYGINGPKMSRITNQKQKHVKDKNKNSWQLI